MSLRTKKSGLLTLTIALFMILCTGATAHAQGTPPTIPFLGTAPAIASGKLEEYSAKSIAISPITIRGPIQATIPQISTVNSKSITRGEIQSVCGYNQEICDSLKIIVYRAEYSGFRVFQHADGRWHSAKATLVIFYSQNSGPQTGSHLNLQFNRQSIQIPLFPGKLSSR